MIRHYFKIAIRNLQRQKALSFINIAGLSIGIACFSLFLLYAVNEFSYDRFHKNASAIYRVCSWWDFKGKEPRSGIEPASVTPLGPSMKQDFPDVEDFVRVKLLSDDLIKTNNQVSSAKVSFADPQFFSIFTFPLLHGNPATALQYPNNIVLTKQKAEELFGETNVIGRRIDIKRGEKYTPFIISAVAENIPVNSSIQFEMLGSFDYILASEEGRASIDNWHMTIGFDVFVKLRKGSSLAKDPVRMAAFHDKYYADEKEMLLKKGLWDGNGSMPNGFVLQPLRKMHTDATVDPGAVSPKNIWVLIAIAAGVLIIACINFTTLAIGRSAGRAKEVGVRKVIGGQKKQLVRQFLAESFLLSFLSAVLGLLLANMLLPYFNQLSGRSLRFSFDVYPELAGLLVALIILVGLLSGSYPALVLSRFRPIEVLKNKIQLAGSNLFTRLLVTFQFVLSIGLIIATVIILKQLSFLHSKNLGFTKENVVMIHSAGTNARKAYPLFRQLLQTEPSVLGITGSEIGLGANEGQKGGMYNFHGEGEGVIEYPVDPDYLAVMNMHLLAGRNFMAADTINSVIVNETLVRNLMQLEPQQAIGQQIKGGRKATGKTIIGVTNDFNFEDLTRKVRAQLFNYPADYAPSVFYVRIKPGDPSHTLSVLENTWKKIAPGIPFNYSFLDEKFAGFYNTEKRWSSIVGWAGSISIFLACLGLFGLAALSAVNRTREIGIRKVMGASVASIVKLLSKEFVRLILAALLIAAPLAWYFMNNWLEEYAYRIHIEWWVFILAGFIAIGIAVITIGFQAVKAALVNPVKNLRSE